MITSYMIQTQNDEEILILYLDYSTEFGIDLKNFHIHNNMKKIIINFITKNQIKFNGEKVFLSVGGILLAVMLLIENTSTYDEAKLTYVNHNIIPDLEISTLVDNTRNSLEINSIKVDSKKRETNSNNKIKEKETTVSEQKPSPKDDPISKQEDTSSKQVTIYRSNGNVVSMDLEEYLIGVVGAEMPASFQMEALKAQAVVARTYALKLLASGKN